MASHIHCYGSLGVFGTADTDWYDTPELVRQTPDVRTDSMGAQVCARSAVGLGLHHVIQQPWEIAGSESVPEGRKQNVISW